MLRYNTQQKRLILPEYGRNIQQMVDHCVTIPDRDERTRCAHTIVAAMGNLFPELRDNDSSRHKLWDHLAVMSGFKLDIDWPCEVISSQELETEPMKVPYPATHIRLRHYGHSLEQMLVRAAAMEPGEERDELVYLLANQMKKQMIALTGDADDAKIYSDIAEYTHGEIRVNPDERPLHEFKIVAPAATGKKKKKK